MSSNISFPVNTLIRIHSPASFNLDMFSEEIVRCFQQYMRLPFHQRQGKTIFIEIPYLAHAHGYEFSFDEQEKISSHFDKNVNAILGFYFKTLDPYAVVDDPGNSFEVSLGFWRMPVIRNNIIHRYARSNETVWSNAYDITHYIPLMSSQLHEMDLETYNDYKKITFAYFGSCAFHLPSMTDAAFLKTRASVYIQKLLERISLIPFSIHTPLSPFPVKQSPFS